jgi:hypothetical protein
VASSRGLAVAAGYAIVALLVALAARRSRGAGAETAVGETGPIADL